MRCVKRGGYTFKLFYFLNCYRCYKTTDRIYYRLWWSNTLHWIMFISFHVILCHCPSLWISKAVFSFYILFPHPPLFFLYIGLYFISAIRWQLLCKSTWVPLHGLYHHQKSSIKMQPYYMCSLFSPYISECMS